MNAQEFGTQHSTKVVLIPGNMMCWKQFEQVVPLLEAEYHVTSISTDGYDGTGQTTFKAVKKLKRAFPNAEDHPFEGLGHGEIIAHPDVMAREIAAFMSADEV